MARECSHNRLTPTLLKTSRCLLRAVIDTCVFPNWQALQQLILAAQTGHVVLIWSPWIIAETHRVLTSRWIDRHFQRGGKWDTAAKRELSRDAHRWLMRIAPAFHVVEDRPPLEPMWTTPPPDEYDWPVWTAAVRSQAHCVVTDNLKDGPPADARGVRQWQGIAYVSPADFQIILDVWSDILEAGSDRPVWSIAEFWDRLHARAAAEQIALPPHLEAIVAELEQRFGRGQSQSTGC